MRSGSYPRERHVPLRWCQGCTMRRAAHPKRFKPRAQRCLVCRKVRHRRSYARLKQLPYDHPDRVARREQQAEWARQARQNEAGKQRQLEAAQRWRRKHPERARAAWQRTRERQKADPVMAARRRELARMGHRLRMERRGTPVRPLSQAAYEKRYGDARWKDWVVPIEPLQALLKLWLDDAEDFERTQVGERVAGFGQTQRALAEKAYVSDRLIRRIVTGEQANVSVISADRLCVALGLGIDLVYDHVPDPPSRAQLANAPEIRVPPELHAGPRKPRDQYLADLHAGLKAGQQRERELERQAVEEGPEAESEFWEWR